MIDALISGKLHGTALERTGKSGRQFVTAKMRAANHEGESLFINLLAFNDAAQTVLLALGDGDAVAVSGSITPPSLVMLPPSKRTCTLRRPKRPKSITPTSSSFCAVQFGFGVTRPLIKIRYLDVRALQGQCRPRLYGGQ